jgi:hypothetical protein
MVSQFTFTLLLALPFLIGCEQTRSPEICIFFDSKEDQSRFIREGAAKIAAQRQLDFSDKSGQHPWPELPIYIGLEGRGFHVTGRREKGYVGTLCFYEEKGIFSGERERQQMKLLQADFSIFFTNAKIPFETGKARSSETKSAK